MKKYAVEGLDGYPNELAHKLDGALELNADLLAALKEVAKGEGPFSTDRLNHANNTITNMMAIANKAIADAEGQGRDERRGDGAAPSAGARRRREQEPGRARDSRGGHG